MLIMNWLKIVKLLKSKNQNKFNNKIIKYESIDIDGND